MIGQFERDVRSALEAFRAEIARAVHRAAIDAIQSAFALVSAQTANIVVVCDDALLSEESTQDCTEAVAHVPSRPDRIVALINENPGCDIALLVRSLAVHPGTLRRHLRQLAKGGLIRIVDEEPLRFGGRRRRRFFVVVHTNDAHAEPSVIVAEATA